MQVSLIDDIKKTQNGRWVGSVLQEFPGDFFYSNSAFNNKRIVVKYSIDDITGFLKSYSSDSHRLKCDLVRTIKAKKKELRPGDNNSIIIKYDILNSEFIGSDLVITCLITKCSADC